jgi:hypothetical protein
MQNIQGTQARHQWCTPVILATQDAEIRRIVARSQPGNSLWNPILKKKITEKGWCSGSSCRPWV